MGRQLTKEEIERIQEWNKTQDRYVSVEAIQDVMNWLPHEISEDDRQKIFGDIEDQNDKQS
jgi:Ca2+-binding EF-hand superfamily protein